MEKQREGKRKMIEDLKERLYRVHDLQRFLGRRKGGNVIGDVIR